MSRFLRNVPSSLSMASPGGMVGPVVAVDKIHSRGKKTKLGHLKSVFHLQRPFIFSFAIENYQEKMVGLGVPFSVRSRFFAVGNCWFGFRVFVRCPYQKNYLGFRRVVVNLPYVIKVRNLIEWKRVRFPRARKRGQQHRIRKIGKIRRTAADPERLDHADEYSSITGAFKRQLDGMHRANAWDRFSLLKRYAIQRQVRGQQFFWRLGPGLSLAGEKRTCR